MELKYKMGELIFDDKKEVTEKFKIDYYLIEHRREDLYLNSDKTFGILLEKRSHNSELIEMGALPNISSNKDKVKKIIDKIYKYSVTPVSLDEIVCELL